MAECSYARCVQERRAIKKELQRWTKNMVFVVGLERVAEELMGRRKWRQYQDIVLRSCLTAEAESETSDWEPQEKCSLCDGGTFIGPARSPASDSGSSTNSRSSFQETPPVSSDGHSSSAARVSSSPVVMTTLESVTSMAASLAAVAALSVNATNATSATSGANANPSATAMSIFSPTNPNSGLFPHWYMSPPPPHLPPSLRLDTVPPTSKQESPLPAMVMSLPASTASEQPLDLSAKATSCVTPSIDNSTGLCTGSLTPDPSLKVPSVIDKHIFKAKPRMSAVAGRRQYTEEELQAALRDIQSGKLGTRRAAVIYGIPRSTLRNKVYKLAMERERDSHLNPIALVDKTLLPPVVALKDDEDGKEDDDEDKELSGAEEEREVEKALRKPLLSMEDLVRFSMLESGSLMTAESLRTLLQHGKFLEEKQTVEREDGMPSPTLPLFPSTADIWQGLEHSALGPFISQILANSGGQNRDLSSGIGNKNPEGFSSTSRENSPTNVVNDFLPKFPSPLLPELVRRMMAEDEQMRKSRMFAHQTDVNFLMNGAHSDKTFCKTEERGKIGKPVGLPSPSLVAQSDVSKADAEESSDADAPATSGPSGMATPPNVILKIPSFKPTSKNGVASSGTPSTLPSETFTHSTFPHSNVTPESSQHMSVSVPLGSGGSRSNHSDSCSPPIPSLSGKGIGVSLRDVIAKSISQKFQQHGADLSHLSLSQKLLLPSDGDDQPTYKRGRFTPPVGCNPSSIVASVIKHHNNNNNTHSDDKNKMGSSSTIKPAASGSTTVTIASGGKGTRPKRGKYRNYDRDSLVEAVRAVQRGEMSVHRAGSYYGVPHSTLEYKVKERHLMRPRKREQKVQMETSMLKEENTVVKSSSPAAAAVANTSSVPVTSDKLKTLPKPSKAPFTPSSPLPSAPNGLKIPPLYDPNISHLAYNTPPPFPFWPPSPFHPSLPLPDFARSGSAGSGFSPGSDFFASQMMQRLQEESSRVHGNASPGVPSAIRSPPDVGASNALGKSAREMAESLYDGTGANGSFLDGIIRSSLEMGLPPGALKDGIGNTTSEKFTAPENLSNKALLDQLCRNSRLAPLSRPRTQSHHSSDEESLKQLSDSGSTKSAAEACPAAVVDLSSVSSGKKESENKTKSAIEEEAVRSPKPVNTKEKSSDEEEDVKSLMKETNGLSNAKDDPNDNVSACDSMSNLKRVSDIDAAKDLQQEGGSDDPETQEDTKSNKINS